MVRLPMLNDASGCAVKPRSVAFCTNEPSGFPEESPSCLNCPTRYATALSSPGVAGPRPSSESSLSAFVWRMSPSALMAARAGAIAVLPAASFDAGALSPAQAAETTRSANVALDASEQRMGDEREWGE